MQLISRFLILAISLLVLSCGSDSRTSTKNSPVTPEDLAPPREAHPFASALEEAHGASEWEGADALQYEFALRLGEKTLLARILMETDFSSIKFITDKQEALVWDTKHLYVSPKEVEWDNPRFDALTWPYLTAAPFKLNDPGTQLDSMGSGDLLGQSVQIARVTFGEDAAAVPQSWYQVFKSDSSGLLVGMAYPFNLDAGSDATVSHVVTFHLFGEFEGIKMATEWRFWEWSEEEGLGKRLGTARLAKFNLKETSKMDYSVPFSHRTYGATGELED